MTIIGDLIMAGRDIVAEKLVRGSGGNLSGRNGETIFITRSGADLSCLTEADFVTLELNQTMPPTVKPSSELTIHLAAYRSRPETLIVLHVHPPKAISLGLLSLPLPALTPDFYLHLGAMVPFIPYITPTTIELADAIGPFLANHPAVLLQNHGVMVTGRDTPQALLRLFLLEEQAAIYLDALPAGTPRTLTPSDMHHLDTITAGRYKLK